MNTKTTAKNTSIHVATVSIKTLQVDNSKMTLAVFRQLTETSLYTPGLEFWGVVKYDCAIGAHRKEKWGEWVIAVLGNNIYKCPLSYTPWKVLPTDPPEKHQEIIEAGQKRDEIFKHAKSLPQLFIAT